MRLFLLLLIFSVKIFAQSVPVNVSLRLSRPYSLRLSDYLAAGQNRISANIILNDNEIGEIRVKLKLTIQGNGITIKTKENIASEAFSLSSSQPLILDETDLAPLFNTQHLEFLGLDLQQYNRTGLLPEGYYTFNLEVYEYNRGTLISNKATAPAWLVLNDPPRWVLPRNNQKIEAQLPQNIFFNWLPMHTSSPNAAFGVTYEFKLVEMGGLNGNPYDAIRTQTPTYTVETNDKALVVGPDATSLIPGKRYAAIVRAVDANGLDLFKNDGYSEVLSFYYGDECPTITGLTLSQQRNNINAIWALNLKNTSYTVKYRESPSGTWYGGTDEITSLDYLVRGLKYDKSYEIQVMGQCGDFSAAQAASRILKLAKPDSTEAISCTPRTLSGITNKVAVSTFNSGDKISALGMKVLLTNITITNNTYSGEGIFSLPFSSGISFSGKLDKLRINSDAVAFAGKFYVQGASVSTKSIADEVLKYANLNDLPIVKEASQQADKMIAEATGFIATNALLLSTETKRRLNASVATLNQGKAAAASGNVTEALTSYANGAKAYAEAAKAAIQELKSSGALSKMLIDQIKKNLNIDFDAVVVKTVDSIVTLKSGQYAALLLSKKKMEDSIFNRLKTYGNFNTDVAYFNTSKEKIADTLQYLITQNLKNSSYGTTVTNLLTEKDKIMALKSKVTTIKERYYSSFTLDSARAKQAYKSAKDSIYTILQTCTNFKTNLQYFNPSETITDTLQYLIVQNLISTYPQALAKLLPAEGQVLLGFQTNVETFSNNLTTYKNQLNKAKEIAKNPQTFITELSTYIKANLTPEKTMSLLRDGVNEVQIKAALLEPVEKYINVRI